MENRISHSDEETASFGRELASSAQPGDIFALIGDLGAGKTVLAGGFAEGLGVNYPIHSPTFTIVCEYTDGRLPLYHFDVYRIEDEDELFEIGFEDYLFGDGVCLIEWADKFADILPDSCRIVSLRRGEAPGVFEEAPRYIELFDSISEWREESL